MNIDSNTLTHSIFIESKKPNELIKVKKLYTFSQFEKLFICLQILFFVHFYLNKLLASAVVSSVETVS